MDEKEIGIRLQLLQLAKDIVEVNSLAEAPTTGARVGQVRVVPRYSIDQVLTTARRLYDFVTSDQAKEENVAA